MYILQSLNELFLCVSQIVFRLDPEKFVKLKYECDEFISFVLTSLSLTRTVKKMNVKELTVQVQNCQVSWFP